MQIYPKTGAYYNIDLGVGGKWLPQDVLVIVGYQPNKEPIVRCQAGATTMSTLLQGQYLTVGDVLTSYNNLYRFTSINRVVDVWKYIGAAPTLLKAVVKLASRSYWIVLDPAGCLKLYKGVFPDSNVTLWKSNVAPGIASGPYWATLTSVGKIQLMNSYGIIWTN